MSDWHKFKDGRSAPQKGKQVIVIHELLGNAKKDFAFWDGQKWVKQKTHGDSVLTDVLFWRNTAEDPEDLDESIIENQKQRNHQEHITYGGQ